MRALDFLTQQATAAADGVLFDPPYSIHQVKISYDRYGLDVKENITGGFPKEKWQVARILRPGGLAISFGWNTVGMGMKRGFDAIEYLVVSHGGNRNDTLVTVERRRDELPSDGTTVQDSHTTAQAVDSLSGTRLVGGS